MKFFVLLLLLLTADFSIADSDRGAKTYSYGEMYVLIVPCDTSELFIDLRQAADDRVLDTKRILSRYMPPEYEMRDVTGDGIDEILVYTKGGGSGVTTCDLIIYTVDDEKLIKAGVFEVEGHLSVDGGGCEVALPDGTGGYMPAKEAKSRGAVKFLLGGTILYSFASAQREDTELILDFKTGEYRFNPATAMFVIQNSDSK